MTAIRPDVANIPASLRALPRWVCWRYEKNRKGRVTKVPLQPDGRLARSNDSSTWACFEACYEATLRNADLGVGFMLGDGIVGVDLDHVRDPESGVLQRRAQEIISELNSYTEVSPGGTGVHILCRGVLPPGGRRHGHREMYSAGRFFTVTGDRLNDRDLEDRTAELAVLHQRIFGNSEDGPRNSHGGRRNAHSAPARGVLDLGDQELIRRALEARDGAKFTRLWAGQWQGDYPSQSEADLALCNMLAFWTGGDADRIDRLFRQSGLMRGKWNREDYRQRTIREALSRVRDPYERPAHRNGTGHRPAPTVPRTTDGFASFPLTDTGNAERLVLRHGDKIRYCHPQRTWWVWTGRRWEADRNGKVMDLAKAVARELYESAWEIPDPERKKQAALWAIRSESTDKKKAALVSAQSEAGIPIQAEQFDADLFALNCLNGTIDLRTGKLRPHRSEDYCTKLAPVTYDPAARSELWERFLREVCGGDEELIAFLQRAVGYTLTGSTAEEKLFFVHGPAAAGKSTFLEATKSVLGDYAKSADFETFVQRREAGAVRNDVAELAGRRFVVSIEVDEGKKLAEGLVKLLTGGDTVRARFLYQESFEYVPQFKLWLAANHAPRVRHDDSAMWRRILRIPFEHVIPQARRDPSVKARLKDVEESSPAILAWAVEGCLRWQEDGLGVPGVVEEATERYRLDMDPLRDFIADCCVLAPHAWTPAAKLREAYEQYCQENGEKRLLNTKEFAEGLRSRGGEQHRGSKGVKGWRGIGLLTIGDQ